MINDEKEVSALRKQIIGLAACLAGLCFSGCRDVVLSTSLNDHILFSGTKTRLSLEECSLVFLDFQTRYNLYYENLGETDFWKEKAGESDFSDYLRDGRIKEELCTLVLLNDMASGLGVTLTDEERSACQAAAADYYGSLSDEEKSYVQSDESKAASLYEKYRISSGEDFESVAKEVSRFSQIEYQVSRGTLNPILEKTAIYMSDGEVSDIIQTEQNYYLIRCVDDFDEVLSSENESQVFGKLRYATWSQSFTSYAKEHTVGISEEIWENLHFYQTTAFTSDDLYETYDRYLASVTN